MKTCTHIWLLTLFLTLCSNAQELAKHKAAHKKADTALNLIYAKAKKTLDKERFAELKEDQKGWLEYRDWNAEFQARGEALQNSVAYWEAMAGYTEARVDFLHAWLTVKPKDTWVGSYQDGYGGSLEITKKNGKLHFEISVVRGPTFHTGDIEGTFKTNENRGRYSDEGNTEIHEKGSETWIDLEQVDGLIIKVVGTNTDPYHGARAYFDGTYRRVK